MPFVKKGLDEGAGVRVNRSAKDVTDTTSLASDKNISEPAAHRPRGKVSSAVDHRELEKESEPGNVDAWQISIGSLKLTKNITITVGIGIILVVIIISRALFQSSSPAPQLLIEDYQEEQGSPEAYTTTIETAMTDEERLREQLEREGIGMGATGTQVAGGQIPVSSDVFVYDIHGERIPEMFEVRAITHISDIVSFTKRRAVLGQGIEFYWLDGVWRGQPVRVVVPFTWFRELPEQGAVIATIEIVETVDGNLIATYFRFDPEAFERLRNQ